MRILQRPLHRMADEFVQRDHAYWTDLLTPMIGNWLTGGTTVQELTTFAEKVHLKRDFNGFKGDRKFIQNQSSQKAFSKLRGVIAGIYVWRREHAADAAEREAMLREADFAFRQALALCPYSPEMVFGYTNLLVSQQRKAEALLIAKMAAAFGEGNPVIEHLVEGLKKG